LTSINEVQVFILHWAHRTPIEHPWNDILLNCIRSIRRFTEHPHEIVVVYDCDPEYLEDLKARLPKGVRLEEDTRRRGASGARNMCIDLAETEYFALLDNDMRVPRGWLTNLVKEIEHAEDYFRAPCVIRPSFLPYLEDIPITADKYRHVLPIREFVGYCRGHRVPCTDDGVVQCKTPWAGPIRYSGTGVTDNGWSLSVWIANREAFNYIGYSDEEMHGWWGEDCDWAIRALKTPVKLLETNTVFIQHVESFTSGPTMGIRINNADIFVRKHGREIFDEVQSGAIWPRLHREQLKRYPGPSGRAPSGPP